MSKKKQEDIDINKEDMKIPIFLLDKSSEERRLNDLLITKCLDEATKSFFIKEANLTGRDLSIAQVTPEVETRTKISRHILKAPSVNIETIRNMQSDLFSGEYELVTGQSKEAIKERFNLIVKDFRGLNLDYWEKKVVIACYCAIDKQNANTQTPFITIGSKADLYKEVLEKDKKGNYGGKERELFDNAIERLKAKQHQLVYYKTVKDGKKIKREYVLVEAPFITGIITNFIAEQDTEQSIKEIKDKGKYHIQFHPVIFDGLIDNFRLIPKNLSREIKAICPEIKKTTPLQEDFILWLHTHDSRNIEIRRTKEVLIKELKQDALYKKYKKRAIKNLHECYEIAKQTGYLTGYQIDQKGKECIVDVFYLNPDKFYHIADKPKDKGEAGKEALANV